ncbi:Aste57867_13955 [Aphanomyces stellatus]|uniref:Aste57867_13955 protein n=1 Tax=Aphanomyces stellatus TaxID=120398 RepID=A0A485L018_9STRA|nr:hypothetical protein As57867_013904 [Aphanomyces stellatus]VFT90785.1 Aste57867_13955 [Aphanomyces stellatus]
MTDIDVVEDVPPSPHDTLLEEPAAEDPIANPGRTSSPMRRLLLVVLVLVVVQLVALAFIFEIDLKRINHAATSWHDHIFGQQSTPSPSSKERPVQDSDEVAAQDLDLQTPAPTEVDLSFVRAAVIYLPSGGAADKFVKEFRWFRRSWIEMQRHEPALWRTDIVVFSNGPLPDVEALNCSIATPRQSRSANNSCILYTNYTSVYSTEFPYAYADSVAVVGLQDSHALDVYDYVLRTDIDTFLTPAFATWKPPGMVVGRGAYSFDSYGTAERLAAITEKLNMTAMTINNVGSTWYGPTPLLRTCANLSVDVMKYLYANEFTDEEKSIAYGTKGWPKWHIGVVSMYAGHLAINHCTRHVGVTKNEEMLDYASSSDASPNDHAHLHTWQNSLRFSKFEFVFGAYRNENKSALDWEHKISDYAMYMALDSQVR